MWTRKDVTLRYIKPSAKKISTYLHCLFLHTWMSYFKRTFIFFPQLHIRLSQAPSTSLSFYAVVALLSPSRRQSLHIVQDSGTFNMSLLNNSNHNLTLDCPIYTEDSKYWMEFINFWVGGVVQTLSIIFGFLGKKLHPNRFHPDT